MLCLIYPNCLIPPCVSKITCMLHIAASIIHLKVASDQVTSMLTIYLKKKKNHPEALFQKALPHHSINNPAQSPGFYGLTYLPTPPLHTHQPPRGGVGSETSKASRPLGSICYRSCNWPEDCEMNHMDGPIWISESPSLGPSVKKIKKDTLHSLMQVPRTTEAGLSINLPAENTGRQGLTDNETPEKRNGKGCSKCGATGHAMLLPSWTHQYCEQINAYSELSS